MRKAFCIVRTNRSELSGSYWFYYPMDMFDNAQVILNTLVTLEDAFIAASLVGVRRCSNSNLRVTSARIMGIESDHRTLARVLAPNIAMMDGGPIEWISRFLRLCSDGRPSGTAVASAAGLL